MNCTSTSLWVRFALPLSIFMIFMSSLVGQTLQQPSLLKDIRVGTAGSSPENLTSLFNKVVFTADDGVNGKELWASDGTQVGTTLIKDFVVGSGSPTFSPFVELGGTAYFTVTFNETPLRIELWKTDGTPLSTLKVFSFTDAMAGSTFFLGNMFTANNKIYIPMTALLPGQTTDNSLWESNGFSTGTRNVGSMISSFQNTVTPSYYYEKGQPIFCMTASNSCSEPLATGSIIVIDSSGIKARVPFGSTSSPGACYTKTLGVMGRNLYFLQTNVVFPALTPNSKVSLFKVNTDGVKTVVIDSFSTYSRMINTSSFIQSTASNNWLYFIYELQMWKTDGTTIGTTTFPGSADTRPIEIRTPLVDGNIVYFTDNNSHYRYWKVVNGSNPVLISEETYPLLLINSLKKVGNKIYSFGSDPTDVPNPLLEIKSSDGQTRFTKIAESRQIRYTPNIGATSNALLFAFNDATQGVELGSLNLNPPVIAPCDTDRIAPVISNCPQNINLTTTTTSAVATWTTPTATDNCTATPSVSSNYTSGSPFGIGTTVVTYTATDAKNNTATCNFNITISNNTTAICKKYVASSTNSICNPATWQPYLLRIGADKYVATDLEFKETSAGTATLKGTLRSPTWQAVAIDLTFSGQTTTGTPQKINCLTPSVSTANWAYYPTVSGTIALPSGTVNISVLTNVLQIGTGANTQNINDLGGFAKIANGVNPIDLAFKLTNETTVSCENTTNPCLTDATPPLLTNCPANISLTTTTTTAVATWTAPTATDNCPTTPSVSSTYNSGFAFPIGSTTVVYTATDAKNNTATCSFTVNVSTVSNPCTNDITPPVWSNCPADFSLVTNTTTAIGVWTNPTVTDNCGVIAYLPNYTSGTAFGIGTTRVIYTAWDAANNTSVCYFSVTVFAATNPCANDVTPPVLINCPTNINLTTTTTTAVANWTAPAATDNCAPAPTVSSNYNSGFAFPIGTTTVVYTATDAKNNSATCSFNILVNNSNTGTCKKYTASSTNSICNPATWQPYLLRIGTDRYVATDLEFKETSTGTATLKGTLRSPTWQAVPIDLTFSGKTTTGTPQKINCLTPSVSTANWAYYPTVSGTIGLPTGTVSINTLTNVLQIGTGANTQDINILGGYAKLSSGTTIFDLAFKMANERQLLVIIRLTHAQMT